MIRRFSCHTHSDARLAAFAVLAALLCACAGPSEILTVSAAASLTDAFTEIDAAFEAAHPGLKVELNLASSGVLAQQIRQGAAVDVYASASEALMDGLEADGLIAQGTRQDFAGNRLVLVTPLDGPALSGPDGLLDVARLAIGSPELVPAGSYAQESLQALGLWEGLQGRLIYGEDVRQVLTWVETGEVPAGIVYASDARTSERVRVAAELPPDSHSPIRYPIAVVRDSRQPQIAGQFVAFVVGPEGQAILSRYAFEPANEARP